MLDVVLVRWGGFVPWVLAVGLAVSVALRTHHRLERRALGGISRVFLREVGVPSRGREGERVTLHGTLVLTDLSASALEPDTTVAALTVRGPAGAMLRRHLPLALRTSEGDVTLEGPIELVGVGVPAAGAIEDELHETYDDLSRFTVVRVKLGERVRACGELGRVAAKDYRGAGSFVLRAKEVVFVAPALDVPYRPMLRAGAKTFLATLAVSLVVGLAGGWLAAGDYETYGREHALPLAWSHRLALASPYRGPALALFEHIAQLDRTEPDGVRAVAAARGVVHGCGAEVETRALHGIDFDAVAASCDTPRRWLYEIAVARADGDFATAAALVLAHEDALRATSAYALGPLVLLEAGRRDELARWLHTDAERGGNAELECIADALDAHAAGTAMPTGGEACFLVVSELGGATEAEWRTSDHPVACWAAAALMVDGATPACTHVADPSIAALLAEGHAPPWDALREAALSNLEAHGIPIAHRARCLAAEARAIYRWRRDEARSTLDADCPAPAYSALLAMDDRDPAPPDDGDRHDALGAMARFRDDPNDVHYRAMWIAIAQPLGTESWRHGRIAHLGIESGDESLYPAPPHLDGRGWVAASGDGSALARLVSPLVAARVASFDAEGLEVDLLHRERELLDASLWALRDDALVDLWGAGRAHLTTESNEAEDRADRLSVPLADRSVVVLESALLLAHHIRPAELE